MVYLTYRSEAITPVKSTLNCSEYWCFDININNEGLQANLKLIDEVRNTTFYKQVAPNKK